MNQKSPLLIPRFFVLMTVISVICGVLIGAGLYMITSTTRMCQTPIAVESDLGYNYPVPLDSIGSYKCTEWGPLPSYYYTQMISLILATGVAIGVIPHTGPFRGMVNRLAGKVERRFEEREIREYFRRYP
jgi:hypothetical protein